MKNSRYKIYDLRFKIQQFAGATLIEIVIYILLLMTLLVVLTDVFSSLLELQKETASFSELEQDGKFIMQKLTNEVGNANSIFQPVNLGDSGNTLAITRNGNSLTFFPAGNNLVFNDGVTSEQLNSYATSVDNFNTLKLGNSGGKPLVRVSFRLTSNLQTAQGTDSENFEISIGTR